MSVDDPVFFRQADLRCSQSGLGQVWANFVDPGPESPGLVH